MKIPYPRLILPATILLLSACLPALGESWQYTGPQWAPLDSAKIMASGSDITLAKYPDCDDAIVDENTVEQYKPDGTAGNQDEAFVKVLTEKGKRNRRTLTLGFLLPYFKVQVVKLEVIRPSGEIIPVDVAANSTVTIDDSQMEENIYDPNSKVMQVNIPDLEIGDVVHWITRTTTERSIIPGEFADGNEFEAPGYIRHTTWEVYAPLEKPLKKIVLKDEIPGTVKYTTQPGPGHTLIHRWEVTNVPRMFDEPAMPPYENVLQRALASTTPDWATVSKWYWALSEPHLKATSPEMLKTVTQLTAGAKSDLDKAHALFYYVSQKVRYMGLTPEQDRPGFEPHDVCMTFAKQYGVCRDKAALLVAMLRAAGLKAYPVLVNVGSKKDEEVPDAGFNHAIVGIETTPGQYMLLDPTDEHARDFQPWYDGDQSFLVARPEGENIHTSSFKPPGENMMTIKTTGTLTASGQLVATSDLMFGGANDDIYRNEFSDMKPDDERRFFEHYLKEAIPGARLTSLKMTPENMLDVSIPIKAEIGFTADDMTATGHGTSVITVPWIGNDMGIVNRILDGAVLQKRKYAMQTRVACGLHEEVSLKLGNGFGKAESLPVCPPVEDASVSYHQTYCETDGSLDCTREFSLKDVETQPSQYAQLKRTLKALQYDARKSPMLAVAEESTAKPDPAGSNAATPPVDSNSVILDSQKELDVTGAHSAVYHVKFSRRILTYAGKIGEAEIKIGFDPACQEAHLISGVVISKTGQRQEISKGEINLMDADWSASAKRYTGGKILVANLPGVDIGSTIEVEFEMVMKNVPFIGGFEPFQLPDDLQQKSFVLKAPAGLKVQQMIDGAIPLTASHAEADANGLNDRWTAKNIAALPAETSLPPDWVFKSGVSYYIGDYKAYLKELKETMEDRSGSRTQVALLVRQLTAGQDKLTALKSIRDFVAKSIRTAGPSFTDLPLSELSKADTTLTDGYGHQADHAILLHAMLSAAGFQPEFVLASDLPAMDGVQKIATSFPLPDSFNTPLVKVTVDGVTYYLNDTDQYAQLGSTPHDDRLGINLTHLSNEVIKATPDCKDKVETDYTLSFADDGGLQMGVTKHYFGNEYNDRNRYFSELRPEERRRYFQEVVSDIDQGARPVGDLTAQFNTYPGTEQFTVALDNYAVVDGKYLYFSLPFTPSLVQLPGSDRRALPLMLSGQEATTVRTQINLPVAFRDVLISPRSQSLEAPAGGGSVRMTSSASPDGTITLTDESQTSPALISPSDYPAMVKLESQLENKSSKVFLLEKQ